jgi:M6 family metalloprotease-like protein
VRFKNIVVLPLAGIILLLPSISYGKTIMQLKGIEPISRGNGNVPQHSEFKSDVSQKNLLGLERPAPYALPIAKRGLPLAEAAVLTDSIHILVLKVDFRQENPDDPNTTGDGNFDLRTYEQFYQEEHNYIDPAPHNTSYFNSHMEALRRYWYFVSDKRLNLTWDIFPREESLSFRLPVRMAYYGSAGPWADSSIGDRLGHFITDAIMFSDSAAPQIDFSRYQAIIVFHAGSDQQNNIAFINNTPDDFFTGFLRLGWDVSVDNGATTVNEGMIIPETASQDNRLTALNGVMAHEFGHQLGLVDLYNTANFLTQIGDFSLMDDNGMSVGVIFSDDMPSVGGTMPVYPDAWSRAYLGFNIPRIVTSGVREAVTAAAQNHFGSEIIKVPITDFEYFLIENRQPDVDTLPPDFPLNNVLIGDPITNVILGPGFAFFQGNDTILVADGEYDRLLPGKGMLIWHVDEYPAYINYIPSSDNNNFFNNTLQWDHTRRFLSLVEADGIIDFGGNYYNGYGDNNDCFKVGVATSFTPYSRPSSHTNLGADSHVFITNISASDTIMTADINIDWNLPGWPQMSRPAQMSNPVIANLGSDSTREVLAAGGDQLLMWRFDGSKFIANADSIGIMRYDSSVTIYPLAVVADCNSDIVGRPVVADLNGDGALEIVVATASGSIYAFNASDNDHNGRADLISGFPVELGTAATLAPIAVNFLDRRGQEILAFGGSTAHLIYPELLNLPPIDSTLFSADNNIISASGYTASGKNIIDFIQNINLGDIVRMSADSGTADFARAFKVTLSDQKVKYIASGDFSKNGGLPQIAAVLQHGVKLIGPDGLVKWTFDILDTLGQPALGDLNSDGYPEIVVAGDFKIYALSYTGTLLSNFPINLAFHDLSGANEAAPIIGDLDGDNKPDIAVGLSTGSLYAYNFNGDPIAGFPLPSSFGITRACALGDLNRDNKIDLVSIENSGLVKAWNIASNYAAENIPWGSFGGTESNSNYLLPIFDKPLIVTDQQLPENSVYNYPNPAKNITTIRYYLNSDSDVKIEVFDMMGENILSVGAPGAAHVDNEYQWNCTDIASGVYFCRVEAHNSLGKVWRLFKIAIVK